MIVPQIADSRLGNSGLIVSRLSLGSWVTFGPQVKGTSAYALMRAAYEAGVNFFDNAGAGCKQVTACLSSEMKRLFSIDSTPRLLSQFTETYSSGEAETISACC